MENNILDIDRAAEEFAYSVAQPEQRTEDWFTQRLGRFTASRISELLGVKGLGLTGENYAFEKACEIVFGRDNEEGFESFDMRRGTELEPMAFEEFKRLPEVEFKEVKNATFVIYGNNAGASPDGLVGLNELVEIKCPRAQKFFKIVQSGEFDKKYNDQMQMQMLCTEAERTHFFNYIIFNGKPMFHNIIVERDEERINLIKERIEKATEIRDKFVQELIKNKQF